MTSFTVDSYYRLASSVFPQTEEIGRQIRRDHGYDLYPFLWNLLSPLLLNVGMHGARRRRKETFELAEQLIDRFPELANEIGVAIVEVAPSGWFEVAKEYAGPAIRARLDAWEPGWEHRDGPRTRAADPYRVEQALKMVT
jgi:hypothetical protein